jgi:hypothetical protein
VWKIRVGMALAAADVVLIGWLVGERAFQWVAAAVLLSG